MFGNKNKGGELDKPQEPAAAVAQPRKYLKPKILALDLEKNIVHQLLGDGWNVASGTFGSPYKVDKSSGYAPVIVQPKLPNFTEQEIIIVDLSTGEPLDAPEGEKHAPDSEFDWWAKCSHGTIDPRPRSMFHARDSFDRTLAVGGIFIVFADALISQKMVFARKPHRALTDEKPIDGDLYSFLSVLGNVVIEDDHGTEMFPSDADPILGKLLSNYLDDGEFSCVLQPRWRWTNTAKHLATNKFGAPVGIVQYEDNGGAVIILPQIVDKVGLLSRLLAEFLPEIAPHLFPHVEQGKWTSRDDYEHPIVLQLMGKKEEIAKRAQVETHVIDEQIECERNLNYWLHNLLTGTDSPLVDAVKRALEEIGFQKIIDVDVEQDKAGKSRREDLQIHDQRPTLIVDIKGIGGYPADEDALQADKHAAIRMREWNRTDVLGLSIINHQRHLPALDREQRMPFRQELVDAAEVSSLGLMTTWDLYCLVRNLRKNRWQSEQVKPLFYREGRIYPVPLHYELVGKVAKAWTEKFGFVVENGELHVGDRIAIEFPVECEEIQIESMMVNDKSVQVAISGDPLGLLWPSGLPKLREGLRVFRILTRN